MNYDDDEHKESSAEAQDNEGAGSVPSSDRDNESRREDLLDAESNSGDSSSSRMERHRTINPQSDEQDSEVIDPAYQGHEGHTVGHYLVERNAPLPLVSEFGGYEDVLPGAADRILKMAESSMEASRETVSADAEVQRAIAGSVRSSSKIAERQQWIFAGIAVMALFGSFILAWNDKEIPSVIGVIVAAGSGWLSLQAFQKGQKVIPKTEEEEP